ncbi:hypothetical protein [uncultured Gordonia sp.]|nr:hypothetical protein [uncultured Gordonia sp.]HNP59144.1 hypothetical protein [Gordonia sp. (in: high G+C Gram-positive bacteria)]
MDDGARDEPLHGWTFEQWAELQEAWWAIVSEEWPGYERPD